MMTMLDLRPQSLEPVSCHISLLPRSFYCGPSVRKGPKDSDVHHEAVNFVDLGAEVEHAIQKAVADPGTSSTESLGRLSLVSTLFLYILLRKFKLRLSFHAFCEGWKGLQSSDRAESCH